MQPINTPPTEMDTEGDLAFLEENITRKAEEDTLSKKLSEHIDKVWVQNQKDCKNFRKEMIDTLRRVKGQYTNEKLAAIRAFKGSEAYFRVGENKCRAAESWIKDIYRGEIDLPWALEPTEIPDMPDETIEQVKQETQQYVMQFRDKLLSEGKVPDDEQLAELMQEFYDEQLDQAEEDHKEEAKERCTRAEKQIRDQNQEGGWSKAFEEFLYYFVRLKFGVIKGPVLTKKSKEVWQPDEMSPTGFALKTVETLVNDVYCCSPFNFYPSIGMTHPNDGDIIELHELSKQAIADLIGVKGYSDENIRGVLAKVEKGSLKGKWFTVDDETEVLQVTHENKRYDTTPSTENTIVAGADKIWAQEFYGTISGKLLMDWGLEQELDPQKQYQANAWKIGPYVIKAVINPDTLGRKPYHVSSWAKNPEWMIGEGLLEFAGVVEDSMNALGRALINNVAIASGPMCETDSDRVDADTPIYPWRQIKSTSMQMRNSGPAVTYYQPQMHAGELTQTWAFWSKLLDEMTVPAYAQGASQSGVTAGTATVFTQLLAAASRSIKAVVANIDADIITPFISMQYAYNMRIANDLRMMGDARVVAKGVSGLQHREQQAQRKVEYLQIIANPAYQQILGAENIGSILAQVARSNDIDLPDKVRLEGGNEAEQQLMTILNATVGVDPAQENGQMANGGGAPTKPQGTNPDGAKAGVNNG
jgi:vacuolar-type H+-ATPase subunit H